VGCCFVERKLDDGNEDHIMHIADEVAVAFTGGARKANAEIVSIEKHHCAFWDVGRAGPDMSSQQTGQIVGGVPSLRNGIMHMHWALAPRKDIVDSSHPLGGCSVDTLPWPTSSASSGRSGRHQ